MSGRASGAADPLRRPGLRTRFRNAGQLTALDELEERLGLAAIAVAEEIHLMSEADVGLRELERRVLEVAERRLAGDTRAGEGEG